MTTRSRQAGFTLAEALVIVAIIGIVGLIVGVQVTNYVSKANLEQTTGEVRTFLESAKTMTVTEHSPITVRYQLVSGKPTLQLIAPAGAPRAQLSLPDFVKASVNPGSLAPGAWPTPTPGDLFTCDTLGRTLSPAGAQVSAMQVLSLTHKGMVNVPGYGDIRPRLRYDIELYPLWTVGVTKRIF